MLRTILLFSTVASMVICFAATPLIVANPGGPPSIRLAEKHTGHITRSEWIAAPAVKLGGCVADARITSMTLRFDHSKGRPIELTAANGTFTREMKELLSKMPDGTSFTLHVEVKDAVGKKWEVPDATFTIAK